MAKDLNSIYEDAGNAAGEQNPGDPPVNPGDAYLNRRKTFSQNMSSAGSSFKVQGVAPSDQNKFFGETGIYDPRLTGQDIALEAGSRQSTGNKLIRRVGNLVPNITADLVDMTGSIVSLLTEWGDERDYRNGLNDLADSMKNPAGENYKRSNDTWAIGDPTWWIDNAFNTIEFAGAYALGGMGIAKGISSGVKGLGNMAELGAQGMKWMNEAGKLGTSALVSYAQGAQDGATVFKTVYDNQFLKAIAAGQDPEQAKQTATHIAAQSAATTAQLSTLLTMGINTNAYAPAFRSQQALAKEIIAARIAQAEGSSLKNLAGIVRGMNADDYMDKLIHRRGITGVLDEMLREGGEEVLQQFAQQTGADMGNKGKMNGFFEQFGELENLIDRVGNSEGLLAFTLGAAFGGLQHTLINNVIPSKRIDRISPDGTPMLKMDGETPTFDEKGNPVFMKRWVTPRAYERDFTFKAFDSVKAAIAHDFDRHEQLKTDYLMAVRNKKPLEADEVRDEMFNTGKLYAVKANMTEPWKRTFQQIADMTPEEAMEAGYAESPEDLTYREKANEAIADMDHLNNRYQNLQTRYGMRYEENQGLQPLIDMVFARETDLYSTKKRIDKYKKKLAEEEQQERENQVINDPENFNIAMQNLMNKHTSATEVNWQIDQDLMELEYGSKQSIDRILKKYRAIGFGTDLIDTAERDLISKLNRKKQQMINQVQEAEMTLLTMPDYQAWLADNPEGSFDAYLKEVKKQQLVSEQNTFKHAQLAKAEAEMDIAQKNLNDMTSEKNATRFMRKATEWAKSLQKEGEAIEKEKTTKLAEMAKDRATLTRLANVGRNKIAEKHRSDRDTVYTRILENNARINDWQAELKSLKGDYMRASALRKLIRNAEKENTALAKRGAILNSLFRTYSVPLAEPEPQETETVDGTDNGKSTQSADEEPSTSTEEPVAEEKTVEDLLAEIEGASTVEVGEYATIEDELEAMRKEIESESEVELGTDPIADFQNIYNAVHKIVRTKLQLLVDGQLAGEFGHSLDSLNPEIQAGLITAPEAHNTLIALRDYVEEVRRLTAAKELPSTVEPVEPIQSPEIIVSPIAAPDTPVLETDPNVTGRVIENPTYHAGFKIVDAAYSGAVSTIGYEEGTRRMKNGQIAYVKVTKPDALIKPVSDEVLNPKALPAGHPLIYEVHWEYEGEKKITDNLSWDENQQLVEDTERGIDYLDGNGNVKADPKSIGNVPIRVKDAVTGKHLFHIHKMDWIDAKFPGTKDYRNVAESTEQDPDNISTQKRLLYELRKAIVEKYNNDKSPTEGAIAAQGKGTGRLILNHVIESKDSEDMNIKSKVELGLAYNRKNPEQSLLPDYNLQLAIVGPGGVPQVGKGYAFKGTLGINTDDLVNGAVGAMVPGANGEYLYAPLLGMKLVEPGKPSPALSSVVRAIELYIMNDGSNPAITAEINDLEKKTNFNVGTAVGLKSFINQYYTYTQNFQDSALSPNANTGSKAERFVFSIDVNAQGIADKTKQIKAGFTMRGDGVKYANLNNGALSPDFINMLAEGFAERARAVVYTDQSLNIKGINSRGFFTDAMYLPGKGWKFNEYNSYNEYVKSFSRTPVYGRNQLSDGTYVYTANPHLPITPPKVSQAPVLVKPNTSIKEPAAPKSQTDSDADFFDSLGNYSLPRNYSPVKVPGIGTGSDNSVPLTFAALQEKYNFTAEEQRNGKTVLEVFQDLTGRGHTYLSDGYNPFSRCL